MSKNNKIGGYYFCKACKNKFPVCQQCLDFFQGDAHICVEEEFTAFMEREKQRKKEHEENITIYKDLFYDGQFVFNDSSSECFDPSYTGERYNGYQIRCNFINAKTYQQCKNCLKIDHPTPKYCKRHMSMMKKMTIKE